MHTVNPDLRMCYDRQCDPVGIGCDPGCTISLPDLPAVAVRVIGASNHKLRYRMPERDDVSVAAPGTADGLI